MEPKELEQIQKSLETVSKGLDRVTDVESVAKALDTRIKELETELAMAKATIPGNPETKKAKSLEARIGVLKAMQKGKQEDVNKAVTDSGIELSDRYKKAINETVGTGSGQLGGFIPEEWSTDIAEAVYEYGAVAASARRLPMNRLTLNDSEYVNGLSAVFINTPGTAITSSVPSAVQHTLVAKEISVLTLYDASFLADATPATISIIEADAARALAQRLEYAICTGSGSADANNGGITGILNAASNGVTASTGAGSTFTGALTVANLNSLIEAVPYSFTGHTMGYVAHRSLRSVIRNLTGGPGGSYIWSPGDASNRDVEYINGYPVYWVQGTSMPALSTTATGTKFIAFGALDCIRIGDRQAVSVAVSDQFLFDKNQVAVRWIMRADAWILGKMWATLQTAAS